MKTITTTAPRREGDASLDATLNPVELSSKEIVAWGIAFPRPEKTYRISRRKGRRMFSLALRSSSGPSPQSTDARRAQGEELQANGLSLQGQPLG